MTALAVVISGFVAVAPAHADVSPPTGTPSTVTADALPTVQINGIVWDQAVVGNVVYAAGKFTSARPAGAAAGTNETPRSNLLAYDITTGVLITSFAPSINAQVRQVEASPDGTRLYIVGDFTTVNGQTRNRVAAFDLPSGTLSSFNPNSNGVTSGVAATNDTVYLTGTFGRISGNDRAGAAAVTRAGALLPWAPVLEGRQGRVVVVSPDGGKVVLGGNFQTLNGSSNPGYGLAMVSAADASLLPFQTNDVIRNAGLDASILSLKSDGAGSFYGTGYVYGSGGNLEGSFRSSWATGSLVWVNDCHGDEYDVQPMGDVVYAAGHSHYCGSLEDGFPQSDPWTFYRGIAVTNEPARITPAGLNNGYYDFGGNPAPRLLHWFPSFNTGSVSGASQGPWTVNGNGQYLVYGGEFTRVNNTGQQGLVRFAVGGKSTNAQGPLLWNTAWPATAISLSGGSVRVSWPLNYDRDSEFLTYEVLRGNVVVKTFENVRSKSPDWGLPAMAYIDNAVTSGATYTYRVRATDPQGHAILGGTATVTASGTSTASAYRDAVLADAPLDYWPLDDDSTTVSYDWAGAADLSVNSGVARGTAGAMLNDARPSSTFDGSAAGFASTTQPIAGPDSFGIEAWIKTTTTAGGKIVGFGNSSTGTSSNYDRHVYMEPDGRITFGVYPGSAQTITSSKAYNDGQWHQISAGMGASGMVLYVDGVRVAMRTDVTSAQPYNGYWRVGGDSPWSGNAFFAGAIDDVAIYGAPLTRQQVAAHYVASGRTLTAATAPSDAYGAAVYALEPSLYWRLGEQNGPVAADSSGFGQPGTYIGAVAPGAGGALAGVADTAATFAGGQVISKNTFSNPRSYSLEAWFQTSTTTGGKIIGFGNSPDGNSNNYDRHVYMTPDGTLVYGVWVGFAETLQSGPGYNDGAWHHVVATQGSEGMRLYVDGVLKGSNTQSNAQDYTGYWHVGGDVTWGPGDWEFDGRIDEVAVYAAPLAASDVAQHHALGATGAAANLPPTASFTSSVTKLAVAVDGSGSTDADGTVAGYSWSWGDGTPDGAGATATHTYAAAGTYTVTLTVTDDKGATATSSAPVIAVANQAPSASFTSTATDLTVAVDAGGSTDGDGHVTGYAWNWGDGSPAGSGVTATHAYTTAGPYTITLTVTDDDGATATQAIPVTVTAPVVGATYANDSFNRAVAAGLGTADNGGAWTLSNTASNYRVDGTKAVFIQPSATSQRYAYLTGVSSTDTAVDVDVTLPQRPVGGSAYVTVHSRRVGTAEYKARLVVAPSGGLTVQLQQTGVTLANVGTALTVAAGDTLHVRTEAVGTSPTTLRVKVWKVGTAEPTAWTATATDATAALQAPGAVGLGVYLGGGVTTVPFETRFDNFWAGSSAGAAPVNQAPTAAFTSTPSGLSVAVDGSGSSDPDGTVTAFAWDFGDGATGTGATASHAYAAAGTYTVKLTVTDDKGATGATTNAVTVTAPVGPVNQAPTAAFTSTPSGLSVAVDGSGSSDPDGTVTAFAWDFGDGATGTGATASHAYAAAGTYTVKLTVTDDKGATGTTTNPVTVTAPAAAPFAVDAFERTSGTVLGAATTGGTWTQTSGTANVAIDAGAAKLTTQAAGQTRSATLNAATSTSTDLTFGFSLSAVPTGARMYVSALGRVVGSDDYRARWVIAPGGAVQAQLARGGTVLASLDLPGLTVSAGTVYSVRVQVDGTGTTALRSKIWPAGTAEPAAWQLSTTDTTAALQTAGFPGFTTYAGTGFTALPSAVRFDDFQAKAVTP
ncbi:PKD domain-containing protein [Microbacterium hominis]|uniref:PKD domain-containing protein n=1 Tax=Microbacterium hominis TaxID=162426 RepID=UPI0019626E2C|nr:PKD domain-containing protein [Microbacterium hominis]QRY39477.1 PKD domain-containing protein [Microbacterium hominis]